MGILGTLLLALVGGACVALFLAPDFLMRLLKALRWSAPNSPGEQRAVLAVLGIVGFLCFVGAIGFLPTALLTVVFFVVRFLASPRR